MITTTADEPLFTSAHAALTFAHHYAHGYYEAPAMAKMMRGAVLGTGKGLVGLDGAGQAGMILSYLERLSDLHKAILILRTAPERTPCSCRAPCCSGSRPNPAWSDAMAVVVAGCRPVLFGCVQNRQLQLELVSKILGNSTAPLLDIADRCGVDRHTAGDQHQHLLRWLRGDKPTSHAAQRVTDRKVGEEERAWARIDESLRAAGLVGRG